VRVRFSVLVCALMTTSRKSGGRAIDSKDLLDEYLAKELTRRQMVQSTMLASVGSYLGASGLLACSTPAGPGNASSGSTGSNTSGSGGVMPTGHLVGMGYHDSDRDIALEAALKETIGLSMIKPGQSVYLRVNSNSGDPYPYSTAPEMIVRIGSLLRDLGVTDIRVGDRSFWGDQNTAANLKRNGIAKAAQDIETTAVVFDNTVDWMTLPAEMVPDWKGTVRLPTAVTTADHQIILSCVKTHFISSVTMSLKISLGLVHAEDRAREGNLRQHVTAGGLLHRQTAQINKAFTPSLIIQDGYRAVISGGPTVNDKPPGGPAGSKGVAGDPKVIIVSTDRIAADVTGIAVLQTVSPAFEEVNKTKPFANPHIRAAIEAGGLGISGPEAFDLSGPSVPNIDEIRTKVVG
jgi:uncharacterized protein (DUF362 family)